MAGVTKHIFEHDIRDILEMWNSQLKCIQKVLPKNYTDIDIINSLKRFYPHEWTSVEMKYWYYQTKDKHIKRRLGKARYNMKEPEFLLKQVVLYRKLMSTEFRKKYKDNFCEEIVRQEEETLWKKRKCKI